MKKSFNDPVPAMMAGSMLVFLAALQIPPLYFSIAFKSCSGIMYFSQMVSNDDGFSKFANRMADKIGNTVCFIRIGFLNNCKENMLF